MVKSINFFIKLIAFINFLFSAYYFILLSKSLADKSFFWSMVYAVSSANIFLGGILLLRKDIRGKKITVFVGGLGIILTLGVSVWSLSFLLYPYYMPNAVTERFIINVAVFLIRFSHPIIASVFLLITKNDFYFD